MLVNRLKEILCDIISLNQSSFIPGCQSVDNVIICQEVVHSLRYTTARKGGMVLKLDLEKAYDRLEWSFVEETLEDLGIPSKLIAVIMGMLRRSSCRLLWNGDSTEAFKPSRGLCQGDPLSPYLFVLCLERLSRWILNKVAEGRWRPVKPSRGRMGVSHLFFADDIILFAEASEDQVDCIKEGWSSFYRASGQKINFQKSTVFFSNNIKEVRRNELSAKLVIEQTAEISKYLAHYIHHQGHSNKVNNELLQRVRGRLDGWKTNCISRAAGEVDAGQIRHQQHVNFSNAGP